MYIYKYILLNIICSVLIMLLISVFLGMTVSGQIIGVLFPEKDHLFFSQSFLFVYSSFCRIEASWAFPPFTLACPLVFSLFSSHLDGHESEISWV